MGAISPRRSSARRRSRGRRRDVRQALVLRRRRHQLAAEDGRQRVVVGEIEIGQAGDRDVELHRIDPRLQLAAPFAAREHVGEDLDQGRVHLPDPARALQVAGAVHVLAVEQGEELGMREVVAPGELDQRPDRLQRIARLEMQLALGVADVGVGLLEDGEEELVLAGEVVVDELLVDAAALGDLFHARAAEAVAGELGHRRAQDFLARAVGIARAEFDDGARPGSHAAIIHQTVN